MDDLGDFLLELYQLAHSCRADDFPTCALAKLHTLIRFDSGRWTHGVHRSSGERYLHSLDLYNEPPELQLAYREVASQDDPMLEMLRPDTRRFMTRSYQSRQHWAEKSCRAMRDYQTRFAHENVLMAVGKTVVDADAEFRLVGLYRAHADQVFRAQDDVTMLALLPHLLQAQTINLLANRAVERQAEHGGAHGVGIADLYGRLHLCDDLFRDLIAEAWPGARPGQVPAGLWQDLLSIGRYCDASVRVIGWRSHGMVFVRIRRACPADALTPREQQVGRLVSDGQTHKQIARALQITPATARNYVQRLQDKLGVHNRIGIVAALSQAEMGSGRPAAQLGERAFTITPAAH